jgi:ribonucleoside-diphosphate reductase alpha chain
MKIKKRNGNLEQLSFDKIIYRLKKLCNDKTLGVLKKIDPDVVAQRVVSSIYDGVQSTELDEEAARIAVAMTENMEYQKLASRIIISNMHKSTIECFSEVMENLYNNTDKSGNPMPIIADDVIEIVRAKKDALNFEIDYNRDYMFDYFGFKTLEKSYLMKMWDNNTNEMRVVERPQHLYMRVAVGIHKDDIASVIKTYHLISQHFYTHASPTYFNSGTPLASLSSCFHEDTIVATVNRGPIKIKDVNIGDQVVTHKGNVKKVMQLHKNLLNNRPFYELNAYKTIPIKVTGNHKLWAITKDNKIPRWVEVEELSPGDYVSIPSKNNTKYQDKFDLADYRDLLISKAIKSTMYSVDIQQAKIVMKSTTISKNKNQYTKTNTSETDTSQTARTVCHNSINRYITIDKDFARFIGVWYGDGCIFTNTDNKLNERQNRGISIVIHKDNAKLIDWCSNYMMKTFGLCTRSQNRNVVTLVCRSIYLGLVFEHLFGKGFAGKKIADIMWQWNQDLINELVCGLLCSDGSIKKNGDMYMSMTNPTFMDDLYYLLRNSNIDVSISNDRIQKYNGNIYKTLFIPKKQQYLANVMKNYNDNRIQKTISTICDKKYVGDRSVKTIDGTTFLAVRNKKRITTYLPEYVYTLGIEDDHSYNVGGIIAQNCFLLGTHDSIDGIYKTITDCARISKLGGGIGIHISNIRAKGSIIRGTNGISDGIIPMMKVYNSTAIFVNQSSRRKGSFAMYCEPWHADILEFLELKKNQGHDDVRARDLFYAMWTPDLFMKQVESDGDWYLMCPDECPGLNEKFGEEFEELYWKYVEERKYRKVVKAQEVWKKILEAQIETGVPYICYKDSVNKKCNQKSLGTIKSSNLCAEISLFSDDKEYACCNLASIALPKFVEYSENGKPYFNFEKLCEIAQYIITPMNKVIDNNYYPTPETEKSNFAHRPLGIGAQGLADVFFKMKLPFESKEAKQLNKEIFETIYYGCMKGSIEIAKKDGAYSSFKGSPFSEGKFQFDLAQEYDGIKLDEYLSGRWDWELLRKELVEYGARNSMLVALMPTASTAQIMGNIESFEPIDSCIFKRRVLSGEFMVVNKHLVEDLNKLKLWNKEMKDTIIANNGSIQSIAEIPDNLKEVYKTVWEISMKSVIEQCRDRGVFVDQMQSMNLFMANPTYKKLSSMHFYGWKNNLKTGCYYLRSKAIASAGKFSVDVNLEKQIRKKKQKGEELKKEEEVLLCSLDNPESCEMCSS